MKADEAIRIGQFRIDPAKLVGQGYKGWLARVCNRIRCWFDNWAIFFVLQVVTESDVSAVEKAIEHSMVTDRFREFRGGHEAARSGTPISNEHEHTLARLARLTAEPRSKRYTVGRRVYTLYEVEDNAAQTQSVPKQRRAAVNRRYHERSRLPQSVQRDAEASAGTTGDSQASVGSAEPQTARAGD